MTTPTGSEHALPDAMPPRASDLPWRIDRPRVIVTTDIGGTDPDDFQSMVHLLLYADVLDLEGLVSSPYGDGRTSDIHAVIDAYAKDLPRLLAHDERYPSVEHLRSLVAQGALALPPTSGVGQPTEASELIIRRARVDDPRPLHVLAWGGLEDIAQALHDAPDIAVRLRVHWVGGPNKMMGVDAYDYIERHHRDLSMIESNSTYRGFFLRHDEVGGDGLSPAEFIDAHAVGRGALGAFFARTHHYAKLGDTPTVTWLLAGERRPDADSWGGRFVRVWDGRKSVLHHPATRGVHVVETYGVVELHVARPVDFDGSDAGEALSHTAHLVVDDRTRGPYPLAEPDDDGCLRFRFSPRDPRDMSYRVCSSHAALDGMTGSFTSAAPPAERWQTPSVAYADWWTDDQADDVCEDGWRGAGTLTPWRGAAMSDFAARLQRCLPVATPTAPGPALPAPAFDIDIDIDID